MTTTSDLFALFKSKWQLAAEALYGTGGFADASYLVKFTRETDDKYRERQKIAVYENYLVSKVNRYVGYLFKDSPARVSTSPLIDLYYEDADGRGNNVNVAMSSIAIDAKARGVMAVLVDMPSEIPESLAEQMDDRTVPYLVKIPPERIVDYELSREGGFESVTFEDVIEERIVYRYYDRTVWQVIDEDDGVLESGTHGLNLCPVVLFTENGEFPSVGEFTQIADISFQLYNLKSELREILRDQTFSILTLQSEKPGDVEIKLSTDNAIAYAPTLERPGFISPDADAAATYQEEIDKCIATIDRMAYDINTNQAQESGIALQIKFQGLNSSLSNFAMRMQSFEAQVLEVVCAYLGLTPESAAVTYPSRFDLVDINTELVMLEQLKGLGYDLPTYEKLKLERIVVNDLGNIDGEAMDAIMNEINAAVQT